MSLAKLLDGTSKVSAGEERKPGQHSCWTVHAALLKAGFERIDYVAVRRADDLAPFRDGVVDAPARILAAAWLGRTRLIDNMAVAAPA